MRGTFFPGVASVEATEYQRFAPDSFEDESEFRIRGCGAVNEARYSRSCQTAGGGAGGSGRTATRQNKKTNKAAPAAPMAAATHARPNSTLETPGKPENNIEHETNPVMAPLPAATQITRDLGICEGLLNAKSVKTSPVTGVPTIAAIRKPKITPKRQPMIPNRPPARLVPASEQRAAANSALFGMYVVVCERGCGS
jgi:hypothetical protein